MMLRTCYTTVNNLAVCLSGDYYGSMSHKKIARVVFMSGSDVMIGLAGKA